MWALNKAEKSWNRNWKIRHRYVTLLGLRSHFYHYQRVRWSGFKNLMWYVIRILNNCRRPWIWTWEIYLPFLTPELHLLTFRNHTYLYQKFQQRGFEVILNSMGFQILNGMQRWTLLIHLGKERWFRFQIRLSMFEKWK